MEKYFKNRDGETVNIVNHTIEQLEKWPNLTIYIGTDSQCYGDITRYVTTVCYRYGVRGAHVVYHKEEVPRVKEDFMRLYNEGYRTLLASDLITSEIPVVIQALEFDYNDFSKTLSTNLVGAFKGTPNAVFKSGQMIACKAADHVCRNPELYMKKKKK
jgi:predicted RNase H-related nuclease YkuK (DUF458 family)